MRKWLPLFALLLLPACICVDDIGDYWKKGIMDKALGGTWKQEKQTDPEIWAISVHAGEYRIDALNDKTKNAKGYKPYLARTLKIGSYTFFMTDPASMDARPDAKASNLWRYTAAKDKLTLYALRGAPMEDFLKKAYREKKNKNIEVQGQGGKPDQAYVKIWKLDEKVFRLLAQVPDNETYWAPGKEYKRVR
jgi:hypothetical protein